MTPLTRDISGGSLQQEVEYWCEFSRRRRELLRTKKQELQWFAPTPHLKFGYQGWFKVKWVKLKGKLQRTVVARFTMRPLTLFALPDGVWDGAFDSKPMTSYTFNPLWYANERTMRRKGKYALYLMLHKGKHFMALIHWVRTNYPLHLYYGNISGRNWTSIVPSQSEIDHQAYCMSCYVGWPTQAALKRLNQSVTKGYYESIKPVEVGV